MELPVNLQRLPKVSSSFTNFGTIKIKVENSETFCRPVCSYARESSFTERNDEQQEQGSLELLRTKKLVVIGSSTPSLSCSRRNSASFHPQRLILTRLEQNRSRGGRLRFVEDIQEIICEFEAA